MLIYALQSFTATDGTVCTAKNTYTVTDTAGNIAIQRGQASPSDSPDVMYPSPSNFKADRSGWVDPLTGKSIPLKTMFPSAQIKVGSFGDSISNISSLANFDLRTITSGNVGISSERMGFALTALSNGLIRMVANCGVSGENTTNMLARDAATASATRKALTDAQTVGCEYLVMSAGINDLNVLAAGSSQATIDAAVNTALTNVKALIKRARSMGMMVVYQSLMGYSYTGGAAGDNRAVCNAAINSFNSQIKAWMDANSSLAVYVDVRSAVCSDPVLGVWKTGYSDEGLHPNMRGSLAAYAPVVAALLNLSGMNRYRFALPKTAANCLDNADLSAATSGQATRFNGYVGVGTGTITKQIVEINGVNWQEYVLTPTGVDGNGNCSLAVDITIPVFGATPYVALSIGDMIAAECDMLVDDGSGGAPAVFQVGFRARKFGGAATIYSDQPAYNPTISPKTNLNAALSCHPVTTPFTTDEASSTLTNFLVSFNFFTNQIVVPFRVRIANLRVVKLPSGY